MVTIKNWGAKFQIFLLTLAVVISGCTPKGPRMLLDGKELVEQGRYEEAVEKLRIATSLISTNATAWNFLGLAYHHSGQATNAEIAYLKALSLDRNLAEAHFNLGCLHLELERPDAARTELIAYTALRGNALEGWLKLASVQLQMRDLVAAERSFNEALRLDRSSAEALNGLGVIQLQRRDSREAARLFETALKADPHYAAALLNFAIVNHGALNNRPVALQYYRQYLALSPRPENWQTVNVTAETLDRELNTGSRPVAAATSSPLPAVQTVPTPAQKPPATLGQLSPATRTNLTSPRVVTAPKPEPVRRTVKPEPAPIISEPAEIVKLSPDQTVRPAEDVGVRPEPRTARGSTISSAPNPATSRPAKPGLLRQLNPLNLFRSSSTNSRGPAQTPLPEISGADSAPGSSSAVSSFPRYKYRNPQKPVVGDSSAAERAFAQGFRAHQSNRLKEAIKAYNEAAQADPAYFDAFYNLGLAATAEGNLSQALTAYETALAIRPESLDARYNFAVVLKQGNYILDSAREFQNILARNPADARAHAALGNLYAQNLRQPAAAKEHYVKALELNPRHPQAQAIRFWLTSH
jgi:tetratricopeptide (TPR) repeat protein